LKEQAVFAALLSSEEGAAASAAGGTVYHHLSTFKRETIRWLTKK
jgi:hypothetical protein